MLETCRWGILSTATIARKNWKAIFHSPSATLTAVASRDARRAKSFITKCQQQAPFAPPPRQLGDYQQLLDDKNVDAVYIPLPTGLRSEWAVKAAEAGKHVLLEKPCAIDARQLSQIIDACQAHDVQFMDGVMFMHSQRMPLLREVLQDTKRFGELRRIDTNFCFSADDEFFASNIRANHSLEPLGCLGDLGWYCLRLILWALEWQLPLHVTGELLKTTTTVADPLGIPLEFRGELVFPKNVSAGFYCSYVTAAQQWFVMSGTKTSIQAGDFVLPHQGREVAFWTSQDEFTVHECDFTMRQLRQRYAVAEDDSGTPNSQETRMFEYFSRLVCEGQRDARWSDMSLMTQQVLDATLSSARQNSQAITLA